MCSLCPSKREFLIGLTAAGAMLALPGASPVRLPPHRIDVHYHHITPEWISEEAVRKALPPPVVAAATSWTPASAIEEMDRNGVRKVVCSVSNPGVWFGDVAQGRRLSRACNNYAAQLRTLHPGRFAAFAALPLPDVEGSLRELAYALDVLKAEGIGLFTSYGEKWLADPAFAPVFAELNRRRAVIYVHPVAPSCCRGLISNIPAALVEYPADTTRAMLQWMLTDAQARYPNIRLIFSHAGGFTMGGLGRLRLLTATMPQLGVVGDLTSEVRKFYYEISSSADRVTMTALRSFVSTSHILLGTDSPFIGPMAPNIALLHELGLSPVELAAIEHGNATALMPGLA